MNVSRVSNRLLAVVFSVLLVTSAAGVGAVAGIGVTQAQEAGDTTTGDVLYRANAGGAVAATDGGPDWVSDTQYLVGGGSTAANPAPNLIDDSVPDGTPAGIWTDERYDSSGGEEMQYEFAVDAGTEVEVRLYFYDGYTGTSQPGDRVFDVSVEDRTVEGFDPIAEYGDQTGGTKSVTVTSDGTVDVDFAHVTENPQINAIEIVEAGPSPGAIDGPSDLEFESVVAGQSGTKTVTLSNAGESGDAEITVDDVSVTGPDADEFSAEFPGSTTLAPGETVDVDVTFSPSDATPKAATLAVDHDAPNTSSPLTVDLTGEGISDVPVGFGVSGLGVELGNPTSLDFGPDGRLYVAQQSGEIKAFEVSRDGPNDYGVNDTEVISAIQKIPNHNDDGSYNTQSWVDGQRQVTGLTVEGTASTPVIYVTSSDPRIGGGNSHTDSGLDTNSGVISRLTRTDSGWDHDMLVRGLPRSEENHATNDLQYDEANDTLYVAQGGHTNKGAPSDNFALTPEYALSAAVLSVDLDQIESMEEKDAAHTDASYVYDLPTLKGTETPFGGQDGDNMAKWTADSPVDVYAGGFRNAYDVALSPDGRLYATDNSANPGWGGVVANEGPQGECTNAQNEEDEWSAAGVYYVAGEDTYYGHPNPTRGNPDSEYGDAVEDGLHDPVECDFIDPAGGAEGSAIATLGTTPQGMDVYTASNFGGAMQGDLLLAGWNDGSIIHVELTADGTEATATDKIFENIGNNPLDVHAQGDDGAFPGTVWAATYGSNEITVFEPNDYGGAESGVCMTGDESGPDDDADGDGYTNADENAVGTDPCSQASQPADWDQDGSPDSLDSDDDDDGLPDGEDPFAVDSQNGLDNDLPVDRQFEAGQHPRSLFGLGFTGLMTNGTDYADLYNSSEIRAGGATERLSVDAVPFGDAYEDRNSQSYGFQYGVNATGDAPFTVHATVESPFSDEMTPENHQSAGMQIGTGDQDNYIKLVAGAQAPDGDPDGGVQFLKEVDGTVTGDRKLAESAVFGSGQTIELYLDVYPSNDTVVASYAIDDGERTTFDTAFTMPESWYADDERGLAVGLISTASWANETFSASWDRLSVTRTGGVAEVPPTADAGSDRTVDEGATVQLDASGSDDADGDPLGYTWTQTAGPEIQLGAQDGVRTSFTAPEVDSETTLTFEVAVSDDDGTATDTVDVTVRDTDEASTGPETSATVAVNAGEGVHTSTYGAGSFVVENTGETEISTVTIDLTRSTLPDAVFDPTGTAGDGGRKCFVADSGAEATGLLTPTGWTGGGACTEPFSNPNNGVNGSDGYETLTIEFDDFDPGETFAFSSDIDPTSVKYVSGNGGAGSISGLELAGSSVTVASSDGAVENDLFGDGSAGGAETTVDADVPDAPAVGVEGVPLSGTDFPAHEAATVGSAQQTIVVSGPAGATVELLHVDAALAETTPETGYDIDDYEANAAEAVTVRTVELGSDGEATVDVSLGESEFDYFVAAVRDDDGTTGRTSETVILEYDPSAEDPTLSVAEAVASHGAGDDGTISLAELQTAIDWWSTGAEVPDTGGETIGLQELQRLTDAWAADETVGDGSGD